MICAARTYSTSAYASARNSVKEQATVASRRAFCTSPAPRRFPTPLDRPMLRPIGIIVSRGRSEYAIPWTASDRAPNRPAMKQTTSQNTHSDRFPTLATPPIQQPRQRPRLVRPPSRHDGEHHKQRRGVREQHRQRRAVEPDVVDARRVPAHVAECGHKYRGERWPRNLLRVQEAADHLEDDLQREDGQQAAEEARREASRFGALAQVNEDRLGGPPEGRGGNTDTDGAECRPLAGEAHVRVPARSEGLRRLRFESAHRRHDQ
eukprot:2742238-Prymnesium_polylepis.1